MSDSATSASSEKSVAKRSGKSSRSRQPRFFGRIALFVRQVIAELRKVVTPTRHELVTYTFVVLTFVMIMIAITTLLDLGAGTAVGWVFGGSGHADK